MAIINLYSAPELDLNYEHVPWFDGVDAQKKWFYKKQKGSVEGKIYMDPSRTTVTVNQPYSFFKQYNIDYCMIEDQVSRQNFYYFIVNFEYKTSAATTLILELDVIQTYQTSLVFKDTFVERMHVNRWKRKNGKLYPTGNILDEGLEFGDLVYKFIDKKTFRDKYLITSTSPLGVNDGQSGTGPDFPDPPAPPPLPGGGDCFRQIKVSAKGVRFIKGYEGYAANPYYDQHGKIMTTGYGVTQQKSGTTERKAYDHLVANAPASEKLCTQVLNYLMNNNYANAWGKVWIEKEGINTQGEFDALTSFVYNLGTGYGNPNNTQYSPTLWRAIRAYKKNNTEATRNEVIRAFELYRNPGTSVEAGLKARRNAEAKMFLYGEYNFRPIPIVTGWNQQSGNVTDNHGDGFMSNDCESDPGQTPNPDGPGVQWGHFTAYGHDFVYPGNGTVTSTWYRQDGVTLHGALDVGCPEGTTIHATRDGVVKYVAYEAQGYGHWVQVDYPDIGLCTRYAHNSKILVREGQKVKQGEVIALSGNTGRSTGPHYHYELAKMPYINNKDARMKPIPHLEVGQVLKYW